MEIDRMSCRKGRRAVQGDEEIANRRIDIYYLYGTPRKEDDDHFRRERPKA